MCVMRMLPIMNLKLALRVAVVTGRIIDEHTIPWENIIRINAARMRISLSRACSRHHFTQDSEEKKQ